jgi:hypothetical protein
VGEWASDWEFSVEQVCTTDTNDELVNGGCFFGWVVWFQWEFMNVSCWVCFAELV